MKAYVKENKVYMASDKPILGLIPVCIPEDVCLQLLRYIEALYVDPSERFDTMQEVVEELQEKLEKANDEIERLNDVVEDLKVYAKLDTQEKLYGSLKYPSESGIEL